MAIDEARLNDFMNNFVRDMGAVAHAATVVVGDQLGLYKALARIGPSSVEALAQATETDPRYLREWLSAQAASGYVSYDAAAERFFLTEEQAFALAEEGSPAFIPGAFQVGSAMFKAIPKIAAALRTGLGIPLVWIFNLWGTFDLLNAFYHGNAGALQPGQLGAAFFIPTAIVPFALITHGSIFWILLRGSAEKNRAYATP